jgi:hypothetical protein
VGVEVAADAAVLLCLLFATARLGAGVGVGGGENVE